MSDLDRYLTYLNPELIKKAADIIYDILEYHGHNGLDCRPDAGMDLYVTAATRAALSAVLLDIIRQAKAEALREAAQKYQWGGWAERNPAVHADLASRRRQAEHAVAWLRVRADRIEHDARCPHPKCPGGGLCCCLSEQGDQP